MCDGCWKDLEKMRREKWKFCLLIGLSLYFGFPASTSILPLVEESELIIIFYRSIFIVFSFHSFKFRYPSLDNSSNDDGDSSQTSLRIRLRAHLALNILHLHMLAIIKLLRYFSESPFRTPFPQEMGNTWPGSVIRRSYAGDATKFYSRFRLGKNLTQEVCP